MELVLHDLPSRPVPSEAGEASSQLAKSPKFDIIDTSNLADHVGLLNLQACCAPLLKS